MDLSLSEYKAIVEFSPNMIWRAGTDSHCNYFNEIWLRFTGKTLQEECGDGWVDGVHPNDVEHCMKVYIEAFNKRESFEMEYRLMRHDGQWRWINDRGVPFFDEQGMFAGYIGSCMDVTEKVEGSRLTEMAHNDKLTEVYNRNYLDYILRSEFDKSKEFSNPFIIFMMDVDKFKHFNDEYGHSFGDKVLRMVAKAIKKSVRKSDVVGRLGGDEFLVLVQGTNVERGEKIAEKILQGTKNIQVENIKTPVTLSIGIVVSSQEETVQEVLEKGDKAMYTAKQLGGDQYYIYQEM